MPNNATKSSTGKLAPLSQRLQKLGLVKDWDFVLHLPLRYEDETRITDIAAARIGDVCQIQATVDSCKILRGRFEQLQAFVSDSTGRMQIRFLHFYPSQRNQFKQGNRLRLYAEVRLGYGGIKEMVHPKVRKAVDPSVESLPSTLTPIYPAGESVTQHWLRKRIDRAILDVDLTDLVPEEFLRKNNFPCLAEAIRTLHHPPANADLESYCSRTTPHWKRLKYDELLAQQIALQHSRRLKLKDKAIVLSPPSVDLENRFGARLPFDLTPAQRRVLNEIYIDMATPHPMQRLVQGDVGCGKTVVAAFAALRCIACGYQCAFMAPTELLAEQHYVKLSAWLAPLGVRLVWLSGSLTAKQKATAHAQVNSGQCDLIVGTHALIQDAVKIPSLALAIIDEQHRFGVEQRLKLRHAHAQPECMPHMLMLSATPIPRTLAMSYLADIDVSIIDELPAGRMPITTKLINLQRTSEVIAALDSTIAAGGQCYWVCPLIEQNEQAQLMASQQRFDELVQSNPHWRVGLVHGAMPAEKKQAVMQEFMHGHIDVLVSTTVIEVGVDVPNACVMVIEHAERFGLSQLHQLRGRVGRGKTKSFCLMLFDPEVGEVGRRRLRILRETEDGFAIAREDLKLRGPGEFLGARQSGVPLLRFADFEEDAELLDIASNDASQWLKMNSKTAIQHASRWYGAKADFLDA